MPSATEETNENSVADSATNLESSSGHESMGEKKITRFNSQVRITVRSLRHKLADPDGISAKAAIDGLVKANVLFDDSHSFVKEVLYQQEKIEKNKEERTIIVVEEV